MESGYFDWDEANVAHIALHGVTTEEAEDVVSGDPVELEAQLVNGEERFPMIGMTRSGRWLVVVITGRAARVVTSFDAEKTLIATYLKSKWGTQ